MDLLLDKPIADDRVFAEQSARARALLARPRASSRTWPALAAAMLFAGSSMLFVTIVVMAPSAPKVMTLPLR